MTDIPRPEPRIEHGDWLDLNVVNPRRALVLLSAGAVIGLALAAFALFTAKGTSTLIVPPEDIALVNQQPIARSDYEAQLRSLYDIDPGRATPAQRCQVLDSMIREELFVQRAKELDVASADPDVRNAMVNAIEQQAAANAITAAPDDAKLTAYYAAHRDSYSSEGRMTARDVIFPSHDAAVAAVTAIRRNTPQPVAVTRARGRDSGKLDGEEFYFAARIHLGSRLFTIAKALSNGTVSDPVTLPDGDHAIIMIANQPSLPLSFAAARERVLTDYRKDGGSRLLKGDEAFLRKRANILIADDVRG